VINKIDLAQYVKASLEVMQEYTRRFRGERPFILTNCRSGEGLGDVLAFISDSVRSQSA
jgi:urease accessory protein